MLLRMLGLHQLKGPDDIQLEYWGLTSQISKVLPARVLGFLPAGALGVDFPAGVLGFYQPECWGFTRQSDGVLPAGVLRFLTAGVLEFYQPEC